MSTLRGKVNNSESIFSTKAYAKVNLRLKIVGRREDGYHLLNMLNAPLALADELELTLIPSGIELEVDGPYGNSELADPENNIAAKAAALFLEKYSIDSGIRIKITKNIPVGSGLGGGSSDASAVLKFLYQNFLKAENVESELKDLALTLGADVPYFLSGGVRFVAGVGEEISKVSLTDKFERECFLCIPAVAANTSKVYSEYRASKTEFSEKEIISEVGDRFFDEFIENELEHSACKLYPEIGETLKIARSIGDVSVGMSGSGSSVFILPLGASEFDSEMCIKIKQLFTDWPGKLIKTQLLAY